MIRCFLRNLIEDMHPVVLFLLWFVAALIALPIGGALYVKYFQWVGSMM